MTQYKITQTSHEYPEAQKFIEENCDLEYLYNMQKDVKYYLQMVEDYKKDNDIFYIHTNGFEEDYDIFSLNCFVLGEDGWLEYQGLDVDFYEDNNGCVNAMLINDEHDKFEEFKEWEKSDPKDAFYFIIEKVEKKMV